MSVNNLPELGLVCVTASEEVRFRTVSRRALAKLSPIEKQNRLRSIYAANVARLAKAIAFCCRVKIRLYRLHWGLFPFADNSLGQNILEEFAGELQEIGTIARKSAIRLVLQPSQFIVLNSNHTHVIDNSIRMLKTHARILDLLGLPHSPWASINIHGGKSDRSKKLIENIKQLPTNIYSRLTLKNDEHSYSGKAIAQICQICEIPMVFNAHHHLVHERLASYDDVSTEAIYRLAQTTWQQPQWQLVQIANGREHTYDTKHGDLITKMPSCFKNAPWIEVEAKQKEAAIFELRKELRQSKTKIKTA